MKTNGGMLKRVMQYLKGTKYMKLTLSVDNLSIIKWWVDTYDRIHMDCKGHSGYAMSLGNGTLASLSKKQKLNMKNTTEMEMVGAGDALPQMLWGVYFTEAQGYYIDQIIVFRYNQAMMRILVKCGA